MCTKCKLILRKKAPIEHHGDYFREQYFFQKFSRVITVRILSAFSNSSQYLILRQQESVPHLLLGSQLEQIRILHSSLALRPVLRAARRRICSAPRFCLFPIISFQTFFHCVSPFCPFPITRTQRVGAGAHFVRRSVQSLEGVRCGQGGVALEKVDLMDALAARGAAPLPQLRKGTHQVVQVV